MDSQVKDNEDFMQTEEFRREPRKGGTMPEAAVSYLLGSAKESNGFGKETCLKKEVRARGICVRQKFILEKMQ